MTNRYVAMYKARTIQVEADTSYAAQVEAAQQLKVRDNKRYLITVMLIERDGVTVTHSTASLN